MPSDRWAGDKLRFRFETCLTQTKRSAVAEGFFAERLNAMTDGVREREVQPIVRRLVEVERAAHLETKSAAHEQERNVVERVGVALAEFVRPDDERVVEQRAVAARLWCGRKFF